MCSLIHDLKSHCPNFECSPVKQSVDTETGTFKITLAGYWMFLFFSPHSICFTLLTLKDPIEGEGGICSLLCPCHLFFHHSLGDITTLLFKRVLNFLPLLLSFTLIFLHSLFHWLTEHFLTASWPILSLEALKCHRRPICGVGGLDDVHRLCQLTSQLSQWQMEQLSSSGLQEKPSLIVLI